MTRSNVNHFAALEFKRNVVSIYPDYFTNYKIGILRTDFFELECSSLIFSILVNFQVSETIYNCHIRSEGFFEGFGELWLF